MLLDVHSSIPRTAEEEPRSGGYCLRSFAEALVERLAKQATWPPLACQDWIGEPTSRVVSKRS